jgi:hypothetical protein
MLINYDHIELNRNYLNTKSNHYSAIVKLGRDEDPWQQKFAQKDRKLNLSV